MRSFFKQRFWQNGFTLVEAMAAMTIFLIGVSGINEVFRLARLNYLWAAGNEAATHAAVEKLTEVLSESYTSAIVDPLTPQSVAYQQPEPILVFWLSEGERNKPRRAVTMDGVRTVTIQEHPYGFRFIRCEVRWDTHRRYAAGSRQRVYRYSNVVESYIFP
jgi:prepilin-type N-terminal cleavage/methylation domain-containing protein